MAPKTVAITNDGVQAIKDSVDHVDNLIAQARASDEADQRLTIRGALAHHKTAVSRREDKLGRDVDADLK